MELLTSLHSTDDAYRLEYCFSDRLLAELRERNPVLPQGWRRNRHHQWFTEEFGHPALKEHIAAVTALMRAAASWEGFKHSLGRALPKPDSTIAMPIDDG